MVVLPSHVQILDFCMKVGRGFKRICQKGLRIIKKLVIKEVLLDVIILLLITTIMEIKIKLQHISRKLAI